MTLSPLKLLTINRDNVNTPNNFNLGMVNVLTGETRNLAVTNDMMKCYHLEEKCVGTDNNRMLQ